MSRAGETQIAVLRDLIAEQFAITERIDAKTRQLFALAAGFFAVVQAVAFGSFAESSVSRCEKIGLVFLAALSGVLLACTAHRLRQSESLLKETTVHPSSLVRWSREDDGDNHLTEMLAKIVESRRENNKIRVERYDRVVAVAEVALVVAGIELLVALIVRI